jgi:hypothetical protein
LPGIAGVEDARGVFQLIRSSAHLRSIAILMFLSIVTAQIVDLQFSWAIEIEGGNLTFLFGNVYSLMGFAAFVFQLLLSSYVYRKLGVGGAMRVVPIASPAASLCFSSCRGTSLPSCSLPSSQ